MAVNLDRRIDAMAGRELDKFKSMANMMLGKLKVMTAEKLGFEVEDMFFRNISIVMFNPEKNEIHGVGLYWSHNGRHYGNKMVDGVITDWYEVFSGYENTEDRIICHEISIDGEVLAYYRITGRESFKYNAKTDELLQKNYKILDGRIETMDPRLLLALEKIQFAYIFNIEYWGIKPYGKIVELFVDTPDMPYDYSVYKYSKSTRYNTAESIVGLKTDLFNRKKDK